VNKRGCKEQLVRSLPTGLQRYKHIFAYIHYMHIGVVGTGRLGLCQALCLDAAGFDVICYDTNKVLLENIKNKCIVSNEPLVCEMLQKSNMSVVESDDEIIGLCNIIFVFIQTPSKADGKYDHSFIDMFVDKCVSLGYQDKKKHIVISSTVMPEYTDSVIEKLEKLNYDVCYNPTFIAQGSIIQNLLYPNMVLIGGKCLDTMRMIDDIHRAFVKNNAPIHKLLPLEAEITKISINCFITTKISFANMIGDLLHSKGLNCDNVLNCVGSDTRIGNLYLKYGYGFGGPCFPRDNRALSCYAEENGFSFDLCKVTDKLNRGHLQYQYDMLMKTSDDIEFTYITYKDNSDILEESQKLKLAIMLADAGRKVVIKERPMVIMKLKEVYMDKFSYIEI
jgi:nucleotide sugar dehydrogenase